MVGTQHSGAAKRLARQARHWLTAGCLAALLPLAHATPYFNDPTVPTAIISGTPGSQVSATLLDTQLSNFEAADLLVTYDRTMLSIDLINTVAGTRFPNASLLWGTPVDLGNNLDQVQLSFATGEAAVSEGFNEADIALLLGTFDILGTALPGLTIVNVKTLDATLYDIDLNLAVSVLALPTDIPEAGTGWLVLAAGAGLLLTSRRRRAV